MVDYYSILLRAVTAPDAGDAQWRRAIYDRARQMLPNQLSRAATVDDIGEIAAEQAGLEDAIERIEAELSRPPAARGVARDRDQRPQHRRPLAMTSQIADRSRCGRGGAAWLASPSSPPRSAPAAICSGCSTRTNRAPPVNKVATSAARKRRPRQAATPKRPRTAISPPASMAARPTTTCRMCFAASRRSIARCSRSAPSSSISCSIISI